MSAAPQARKMKSDRKPPNDTRKRVRMVIYGPPGKNDLAWAMEYLAGFAEWARVNAAKGETETKGDQLAEMRRQVERERVRHVAWNSSLAELTSGQLIAEASRLIRKGDSAGLLRLAKDFQAIATHDGRVSNTGQYNVLKWHIAADVACDTLPTIAAILEAGIAAGELSEERAKDEAFKHWLKDVLDACGRPWKRARGGRPKKPGGKPGG